MGRPIRGFTQAAEKKILDYPWPGNVRELENRIRQALVLAAGEMIDAGDLMLEDASLLKRRGDNEEPAGDGSRLSLNDARRRFEREYLVEVLTRHRGNATAAAKDAGKHRSEFYDLLKRHGLQPADFRPGSGPAGASE